MESKWNEKMVLIEDKYTHPTRHSPHPKLCPWGILNKDKCIMPCFFYDSIYCTYWMYSYNQERAAEDWYRKEIVNNV